MKLISSISEIQNVAKNETCVLTGTAAFVKVFDKVEDIKSYPGYIKQKPVSKQKLIGFNRTKKVLVAYVHEQVAKSIDGTPPLVAGFVLERYFQKEIKNYKQHHSVMFVYVRKQLLESAYTNLSVEVWGFVDGELSAIDTRMNLNADMFDQQLHRYLNDLRSGTFADAQVVLISPEQALSKLVTENYYVQVLNDDPLQAPSSKLAFIYEQKLGRFRAEPIQLSEDGWSKNGWQDLMVPLIFSGITLSLPFAYSMFKESEFVNLQTRYRSFEAQAGGLPDQGLLASWENKRLYWNHLTKKADPVQIQSNVVAGLTRVNKRKPGYGVTLERLDIRLSEPILISKNTFNVELEVGIKPNTWFTPEEQAAQFAKHLTSAMGNHITGAVDIWDDIVKRTIKGNEYIVLTIYMNHKLTTKT